MSLDGDVKPHFKDFFLYLLIIIVVLLVVIWLFSKNYEAAIPDKAETNTTATSSATPNVILPTIKK